ncbi:MAG: Dam family site-specific DNA-(adenine-N6)-methyltransferase [Luteitalea sp.]|nr:Dam family site-specific DNA-(adenine-N6)-methyltransferase [Luteitalea sp.]
MGVVRAFRRPEPQPEPEPVKPPLKWAGGKRWQLPELVPYWLPHSSRRLVEPFCGGLAVATGLVPDRALLNDVNPHVINFYQWLKKGLPGDVEMVNDSRAYYRGRERFNDLLSTGKSQTAEAATLFYYLNRTGYNGLCRFNSKGGFNVPFGKYRTINYRTEFAEYREAFRGWMFTCMDFEQLEIEPSDFVYADPPYDVPFTQYSKGGFDWDEQQRAAEWLARHKGPVILSNQATPRIVKLYRSLKFNLEFLNAPRRISCTGDRTPAPEVLATRNLR